MVGAVRFTACRTLNRVLIAEGVATRATLDGMVGAELVTTVPAGFSVRDSERIMTLPAVNRMLYTDHAVTPTAVGYVVAAELFPSLVTLEGMSRTAGSIIR